MAAKMNNQFDNFDLFMTFYDIILVIFYLIFAYACAFSIRSLKSENLYYRKFLIKGLTAKFLGGISFSLVYTYFYTYGGDTMAYYSDAELITQYFFRDPITALGFLIDPLSLEASRIQSAIGVLNFEYGGSEFPVVRVATFLNILAMNSYYSTTLLFAAFSYFGMWHFYLVFAKRYPKINGQLAIAIFFLPSVFFWGSGISKDSIVIGFLGLMVYGIDRFLEPGIRRWKWLLLTLLCGYIIFSIKAYIIMALTPALVVWVIFSVKDRIRNNFIRIVLMPLLLILSIVGVIASVEILGRYQSKYSFERFTSTAQSMQSWHYVEGENTSENYGRGSSYSLGEYEPTLWGTIKMFPASVNVALFRPYFWEANNIAVFASAIESFVLFIFTLYIFLGLGVRRVFPLLWKDPFLMMAFTFAIFFAFAVGFTSYNFGALVRYKIPAIPFYVASLLILNHKVKEIKDRRKNTIRERKEKESHRFQPLKQNVQYN